jgi:hypothetical protein
MWAYVVEGKNTQENLKRFSDASSKVEKLCGVSLQKQQKRNAP